MTWPVDDLSTEHFDAGSDSPAAARSLIKRLIDIVKAILGLRGAANGLCELDDQAKVPATRIGRGAANGTASLGPTAKVPAGQLPGATTGRAGLVQLATEADITKGTDTTRAVTPAGLTASLAHVAGFDPENVQINSRTETLGSGSQSRVTGASLERSVSGEVVTITLVTRELRYDPPGDDAGLP